MQGQPLDPVQQKRAMEDPEVARIVQDPAMAQVLKEMQTDPKAAAKYLQDPVVQEKLNTLVYAGLVRLGCVVCLVIMWWRCLRYSCDGVGNSIVVKVSFIESAR